MHLAAEHPVAAVPTSLHNESGCNSTVNEHDDDVPPYIVVRNSHHDDGNTFESCRAAGHEVFCCHFGTDQNGHIKAHNGHWASDAACVRSECRGGRRRHRERKRTLTRGQRTSTGRAASTTGSSRMGRSAATGCTISPRPATRSRSAVPRSGSGSPRGCMRSSPEAPMRTECEPKRHAVVILSVETI